MVIFPYKRHPVYHRFGKKASLCRIMRRRAEPAMAKIRGKNPLKICLQPLAGIDDKILIPGAWRVRTAAPASGLQRMEVGLDNSVRTDGKSNGDNFDR